MAAQLLLLLLLTLSSNVHAELILIPGTSHHFVFQPADFCVLSRWTGEGQELLWNSSASYYQLSGLEASHSGQYQVQCWTRGRVTMERNSTLLVCDHLKLKDQTLYLNVGQTRELTCDGVGPNQSVEWAYEKHRTHGLALIDDGSPSEHKHQLVKSKASLLITVDKRSDSISYYCLERQQLGCDLHSAFFVRVSPEVILRSVGESLELSCSDGSRNRTHRWWMFNLLWSYWESLNSTLMFPSLTLAHSGGYTCDAGASGPERYRLLVCPEPEPPAVELFAGGDNLTLHCGDWNQTGGVHWFIRTTGTGGRVFNVEHRQPDNMYPSGSSLEVRNASLQDSGQVWCVVMTGPLCVFRYETLVMFREPGVDHLLLRSVLLSAVVLMMLSVVVVVVGVVVWRSGRGEQVPAPAEELEMSQLSPESDVQEETPV